MSVDIEQATYWSDTRRIDKDNRTRAKRPRVKDGVERMEMGAVDRLRGAVVALPREKPATAQWHVTPEP